MPTESQLPETQRKKLTITSVLVPVAVILAGVLFTLSFLRERGKTSADEHSHDKSAGSITRTVGEVIPDLDFQTLDGKEVKLSSLQGKVIVINFWATWCGPCVKELPSLQQLANEYAKAGLVVVGVSLDEDPNEVLTPFLAKHKITFQSFIDPTGKLADRFSVSGLPLTLVVDGNRKLLMEHLGDEEWFDSSYRKQFERWLSETNPG